MSENLLRHFSIIESLISSTPECRLSSQILAEQSHDQQVVMTFILNNRHEVEELHNMLNCCKSWLAIYDEQQQSLHLNYHVERSDDHTIRLYSTQETANNVFRHIPSSALIKSQYYLYSKTGSTVDACEFIKNLSSGEYASFNSVRGMKEFVYSFSTHSPLLPVLSHNSLTMHPQTCGYALRLSILIIDHLDLHLSQSRKRIFDTLRRNLITNYKLQRSKINQ